MGCKRELTSRIVVAAVDLLGCSNLCRFKRTIHHQRDKTLIEEKKYTIQLGEKRLTPVDNLVESNCERDTCMFK